MNEFVIYTLLSVVAFMVGVFFESRRKQKNSTSSSSSSSSTTTTTTTSSSSSVPKGEDAPHVPYQFNRREEKEMLSRSRALVEDCSRRRSCRMFKSEEIPMEALENAIRVAGTSPSGAHTEPWTYVVIRDALVKQKLRDIVEAEEKENYERRMGVNWVNDLAKIGTDWQKPYLTECPAIVILLQQTYGIDEDTGKRITNHYYEISSAMSAGMFVLALHHAGLCTVTTTPLNAGKKIRELTNRPENEKVILLFPVGYPSETATVPNLKRKALNKIMVTI